MTDLLELAWRCEQETENLDELFREAFDLAFAEPERIWETNNTGDWTGEYTAYVGRSWRFGELIDAGAYLDAAMTLVPKKWKLRQIAFSAPCADDRKWHVNLHGGDVGQDHFVGRGADMVLALLSAALRALATKDAK